MKTVGTQTGPSVFKPSGGRALLSLKPFGKASRLGAAQTIAYAAIITPDAALGERVIVGALTGNLAINAPSNPRTGAMLVFSFTQDATGGRLITWNAVFKKAAEGSGTANQKGATSFIYDGGNWVQVGGALGWA